MTSRTERTHQRLNALRTQMKQAGVDGYIVPRGDRYFGEEVRPQEERLAFLTGFTGSAGMALITDKQALLLVDGRYTLQAEDQLAGTDFVIADLMQPNHMAWFSAHLGDLSNPQIGFDPWLISINGHNRFEAQCIAFGMKLTSTPNLIDAIWETRPAPNAKPLFRQPQNYAGATVKEKLKIVRAKMQKSLMLVTAPDNLSWLTNLRGADLMNTPQALGVALVTPAGVDVFVDETLADSGLFDADETVQLLSEEALEHQLNGLRGSVIQLDGATCPLALKQIAQKAGAKTEIITDPITLIKAQKNDAEQEGIRRAHHLDGLALAQFLCWFDDQISNGAQLDELGLIDKLQACRSANTAFKGPSFDTIAGSGPNGAIVHYRADETSNRVIEPGDILLLDSGGQYPFGTTDITRTIATGPVSAHQKKMYTLVLKGMIAVSMAQFPTGTPGAQLDTFARAPLWQHGLDFAHGTGHGVGVYLNVHEGPIGISKRAQVGFLPFMLVSNEPGYYEAGAFGIRIENLVLSQPAATEGFLQFETVTLATIDKRLIEKQLLSADELDWLNQYHQRVYDALHGELDTETQVWLKQACAPL